MIVAVTYENGNVFEHFGHSNFFKIYKVEDNKVVNSYVSPTNGSGHCALGDLLRKQNVEILICGGIGGGAQNILKSLGINIYGGVSGSTDEAVEAFLNKTLKYNPKVMCNHHDGHNCQHTCTTTKFSKY